MNRVPPPPVPAPPAEAPAAGRRSPQIAVATVAAALGIGSWVALWRPEHTLSWLAELAGPAAVAACGVGLGLVLLRALGLAPRLDPVARLLHAAAIGLGVVALGVLVLGLAGVLGRGAVVVWLACCGLAAVVRVRAVASDLAAAATAIADGLRGASSWTPVAAALVIALALPLVPSLLPEVFYDSLLYHLEAPEIWLQEGRLAAVPSNMHLNYPVNASALYLAARSLLPSISAGAMHWLFLAASALALIALAGPSRLRVGLVAALLFVATPSVLEVAGFAGSDLAVVLWCVAAVAAWSSWLEQRWDPWLAVAGFELGLAVGAKYTALLVGVAPIALVTLLVPGQRPAARVRRLVILGLAAGVAFAPWLVRNALETGNPIYPYLFGSADAFAVEHSLEEEVENRLGEEATAASLLHHVLRAPVELVTTGAGVAPLVGPTILLPLILLLLHRPLPRRVGWLAAVAGAGFLGWAATVHVSRYALPFVAVAAVPAAWVLVEDPVRWRRRLLGVAVGAALAVNLMLGWLATDWGAVREIALGRSTRAEYAARFVPYLPAVEWANENLDAARHRILFVGEARGFYCAIPHVTSGPANRSPLAELAADGDAALIGRRLRAAGYTHLLVSRSELRRLDPLPPEPAIRARVARFLATGLQVLYDDGDVVVGRVR